MEKATNINSGSVARRFSAEIAVLVMIGVSYSAFAEQAGHSDNNHQRTRTSGHAAKASARPGKTVQDGNSTVIIAQGSEAVRSGSALRDTFQTASPDSTTDASLRRDNGDILLPFVRYDLSRQRTSTHGYATANRLEVGSEGISLLLEDYLIATHGTYNAVRIDHQLLLFRNLEFRIMEVDFGIGQTVISAAQRTAVASVSVSGRVALPYHLAAELRGTLPIADLLYQSYSSGPGNFFDAEAALHLRNRYGSLKIGYRMLVANYDSQTRWYRTDESGVFAGFSVYY